MIGIIGYLETLKGKRMMSLVAAETRDVDVDLAVKHNPDLDRIYPKTWNCMVDSKIAQTEQQHRPSTRNVLTVYLSRSFATPQSPPKSHVGGSQRIMDHY